MAKKKQPPRLKVVRDPDVWERLKGEPAKAFQAFVVYRKLGANRTLAVVANELGKSGTLAARWSSRYKWVQRAEAWDDHRSRIELDAEDDALADMARRHIELAMNGQSKVAATLAAMVDDAGHDMALHPDRVPQWLESMVKIERQARGESADSVDVRLQLGVTKMRDRMRKLMDDPEAMEAARLLNERAAEGDTDG